MNNTINPIEYLEQKGKDIRLSDQEKSSIRENVVVFMKKNPVRIPLEGRHQGHKALAYVLNNPLSLVQVIAHAALRPMAITLILALLLGGGLSVAAEGALPNSPLYPLKTEVTEEVRAWFNVGAEADAEWEVDRAERRLAEAEQLAVRGELTAETQAEVELRLQEHTQEVQERILDLRENARAEAAANVSGRLEAALRAHQKILAQLEDEDRPELARLILAIESKLEGSTDEGNLSKELFVTAMTQAEAAAEGKLQAAENKIEQVTKRFDRIEGSLNAETQAEVEAQIKAAEQAVVDGKARLEAGATGEAFASFQKAHQSAQEAQILINIGKKLEAHLQKSPSQSPSPTVTRTPTPTPSSSLNVNSNSRVNIETSRGSVQGNGDLEIDLDL